MLPSRCLAQPERVRSPLGWFAHSGMAEDWGYRLARDHQGVCRSQFCGLINYISESVRCRVTQGKGKGHMFLGFPNPSLLVLIQPRTLPGVCFRLKADIPATAQITERWHSRCH